MSRGKETVSGHYGGENNYEKQQWSLINEERVG